MLRLSDPLSGVHVDVQVPEILVTAFRAQVERDAELGNPLGFHSRIERHLMQAVLANLEYELQPPTAKQLRFAGNIAGRLRISVPLEALSSKSAMAAFIDQHISTFTKHRSKRTRRVRKVVSMTESEE